MRSSGQRVSWPFCQRSLDLHSVCKHESENIALHIGFVLLSFKCLFHEIVIVTFQCIVTRTVRDVLGTTYIASNDM